MGEIETNISHSRKLTDFGYTLDATIGRPLGSKLGKYSENFYGDIFIPIIDKTQIYFALCYSQGKELGDSSADFYRFLMFQPAIRYKLNDKSWLKFAPIFGYTRNFGDGIDDGEPYTYLHDVLSGGAALYGRFNPLRFKTELTYNHNLDQSRKIYLRPRVRIRYNPMLTDDISLISMIDTKYYIYKGRKNDFQFIHNDNKLKVTGSLGLAFKVDDSVILSVGESIIATHKKGSWDHSFSTFFKISGKIDGFGEISFSFFTGPSTSSHDY